MLLGLKRFDVGHELVEADPPTLPETHFLVLLAACGITVDGGGGVARALAAFLKRDDCREKRLFRRAIAGEQGIGSNQTSFGTTFKIASGWENPCHSGERT